MENPSNMDDLGGTPILGSHYVFCRDPAIQWLVVGVTVRPKHDAPARKTDLARQGVAHDQEWTGEAPRYQSTGHFTGKQFQFSKCSMAVRPVPMCLILVWGMHPKKEIYSNAFRQHVELF